MVDNVMESLFYVQVNRELAFHIQLVVEVLTSTVLCVWMANESDHVYIFTHHRIVQDIV